MEINSRPRIMYVEDDEVLAFITKDALEGKGFEVYHYPDGVKAFEGFKTQGVDLCILDIMMPKLDGYALAEKIRQIDFEIPIIFLSAKSLKEDKLKGLTLGADDYLTKPFSMEELILKIQIFLKRKKITKTENEQVYNVGKYIFNYSYLTLILGDLQKRLTQKEADLLLFFLENKSRLVKRSEVLNKIWRQDDYFAGRSMDVFISRLRKYLSEDENIDIENIHGVGFKFSIKE
ncbi:MAG: response regulator transcription factor [Deltaproteobacteria bacterium]